MERNIIPRREKEILKKIFIYAITDNKYEFQDIYEFAITDKSEWLPILHKRKNYIIEKIMSCISSHK
jgi:hypothetical protein